MKREWVKPVRTAIQCLVAFVPAVPLLVPALGLSATTGVGAGIIAVAALASRIMQIPEAERLLEKLGIHTR